MYSSAPLSGVSSTPNQRAVGRRVRAQVDATSKIAPRAQRTSLASPCGLGLVVHARAACRARRLNETLHCTTAGSRPRAANSSASKVRAKKPRSSASGSGSMTQSAGAAGSRAKLTGSSSSSGVAHHEPPAPLADVGAAARRSRPRGSRAGSARSRAASSRSASGARIGMCVPGQEVALLVRVAVDGVVEEVGADAAVVEQRVALGRRAVADDRACPARLASIRKREDRPLVLAATRSAEARGRSSRSS